MSKHRTIPTSIFRSGGFSLVELMVAMVITLILLAGIGQIFLSSKKSFNIQDSLSRMQENGRYAMANIIQDLRRAGYWGGNADIDKIQGTESVLKDLTTCPTGSLDWGRMLDYRIYGLDEDDDPPASYACISGDWLRGDVLVTRYAAPYVVGGITLPLPVSTISANAVYSDRLFIRSSLFRGRVFLGKDSEDSDNKLVAPAVRTTEMVAHGYFIRTSANSDATKCTGSDAIPSLYRVTLGDGKLVEEEVAYGVDDLQIQYGVDTNNNGAIDEYLNAGDGNLDEKKEWKRVLAARVWLLIRAECPETGFTNDTHYIMGNKNFYSPDAYRRQLYSATIDLRNNL